MNNLVIVYENLFKYHDYYKKSFLDLNNEGIKVFVFIKNKEDKKIDNGVWQKGFTDEKDLIKKIEKLNLQNSFFHTFEEHAIPLVNKLKKNFNQTYTEKYLAFVNKDKQRNLLLNYDKSISINFEEIEFDQLNVESILKEFDFPFVIKPTSSAQSRGVAIINNVSDLENYILEAKNIVENIKKSGYINDKFLVEEFIDGKAFSCDYFVDKNQNIYLTKPVFLEFGVDIGIDDFCNISRIISKDTENMLDLELLKKFIEKNVKALNIKNIFIHHEFKFTSKQEFKTIELNGRIGGFRLNMYDICYNINLLKIAFNLDKNYLNKKLKTNYTVFAVYPKKEGIFRGFDEKLLKKIKKLKSFESIKFVESKIGQKVGLSKYGYSQLGSVRLKNTNLIEFKNDYNFVKENYLDLVILD